MLRIVTNFLPTFVTLLVLAKKLLNYLVLLLVIKIED